jgi:hypothetical protein
MEMRAVGLRGPQWAWLKLIANLGISKNVPLNVDLRSYVRNLCQTEFLIKPFKLKMEFV